MAVFKNYYNVDLGGKNFPRALDSMVCQDNVGGNQVGAYVYENGEAVALGGSCTGKVIRSDGSTVALSGDGCVVSGNLLYVTLTSQCYEIPGMIEVIVNSVRYSATTTIVKAFGTVERTTTDAVVPSANIPNLDQLLAQISAMQEATSDAEAIISMVADLYSASSAYAVGDYCIHDGGFYRCTTAIASPGESWTSGHWTATNVGDEIVSRINTEAIARASDDLNNLLQLAPPFDQNTPFAVGDYCIYQDELWVFTSTHAAGIWIGTDAQQVRLGSQVSALKSAINVLWTNASPSLVQGTYNTGTGVYVDNNRDATTQDFIADDIVSIEVPTAYQTRLYAWNKNGTYAGAQMSDGTFATSGTAGYFEKQDLESYRATYPNYLFKVVILKDNYSAIDIATEKSNFVFNSRVYATVSELEQANENIDNLLKLDNIADISVSWTDNYALRSSDGEINASSGNKVSDFIYVGTLRTLKYNLRLTNTSIPVFCRYDEERNFISAETIPASGVQIGTVSGCVYVRFCTRMDYADNAMLVKTILTDRHDGIDLNRGSVGLNRLTGCKSDIFANLIDRTKITAQMYIDGTTGAPIANSGFAGITDYIEVVPGTEYGWQNVYNTLFAFYNSNYEYISGSNSSNALANPFTAPANSAFVRMTLYSAADAKRCAVSPVSKLARTREKIQYIPVSVETISAQINPIHHLGKEFSTFTKCLCIGDSLTEGAFDSYDTPSVTTQIPKYSYPTNLQKISGVNCTNKGTSGMSTKTWYELHENDDLSGHDVCIIALGINDAYAGLSASTTKTYLNSIISKVKNENAGIRIFVVSCLPSHDHVTGYADVNTSLKEVAESVSGCYFVDMDKYSELRKTSQYINGHLTAIGYNKEAQELYAYIGWIIFTQPEGFKEVQFIGQ